MATKETLTMRKKKRRPRRVMNMPMVRIATTTMNTTIMITHMLTLTLLLMTRRLELTLEILTLKLNDRNEIIQL